MIRVVWAASLLLLLAPVWAVAAGGGAHLEHVKVNLNDRGSLQRGARLFVNYCQGCHSASYMMYNRLGRDLGISDELVEGNLLFTGAKTGSYMKIAMPMDQAAEWFGIAPPDLSLSARSRGADWLYTYLRSFYLDDSPSRPFGVNNLVFKDAAMPHVLWELQGWQRPVYKEVTGSDGVVRKVIDELELEQPGRLSPEEYDEAVRDLVNFMVYLAEPAKLDRYRIGGWVILFLGVFLGITYLLKREYWKDVH